MGFKLTPIKKIYKSDFCEKNGCACMDENHHCLSIVCPYRISVSGTAEEMKQYRTAHCRQPVAPKVEPPVIIPELKHKKIRREVISRDLDGVEAEYKNVKEAAEAAGLCPSTIYVVIRTGTLANGKRWRYKDA
jgi:hypothetical protein